MSVTADVAPTGTTDQENDKAMLVEVAHGEAWAMAPMYKLLLAFIETDEGPRMLTCGMVSIDLVTDTDTGADTAPNSLVATNVMV